METQAEQTEATRTIPEGFGGRTSTSWPAKWRSGQTGTIRLPKLLHNPLTELARQADQQDDPVGWLMSLRPAQQPIAIEEGEWASHNVAQLRQIARERGLKTARAANRAELLEFLNQN
ncbi:hypothetical protein E6Q11_01300 [Candidatus Dojkabacteria bacterium]|uniref:Uncharacterized protein n=1 Tax=Candidatus Dojkabacteria bacterium TaxID=2099670 RepID=A0A5C7JAR0_9BACT|nr:MAG: hypothetical protein E6Q11_01300 [Candidatus Dojkabacteria bacterium]